MGGPTVFQYLVVLVLVASLAWAGRGLLKRPHAAREQQVRPQTSAVADAIAELRAMRNRGDLDAEEFKLAMKYLLEENTADPEPEQAPSKRSLFWPICAVIGGLMVIGQFTGSNQPGSSSASRVGSDVPRAGFVTTMQEVLACNTSDDYGQVGFLWREGRREEADYHARRHCIMVPKGRKVLLIQGGFMAGLMQMQELEVDYLGHTRRLFTAVGDGLFRKS